MFRGRFLRAIVVAILAVGLLNFLSSSIYRAGWSQGYTVGQQAPAGEESASPPQKAPPGRFGPAGGGYFLWGILGFFFKFWLFLFFFGAITKFFWFRPGRKGRRHWRKQWSHHQRPHKSPWHWDEEDDLDEEVVTL